MKYLVKQRGSDENTTKKSKTLTMIAKIADVAMKSPDL